MSAGYSVGGIEEKDLAENYAQTNGFGMRVQLILTDWMLHGAGF